MNFSIYTQLRSSLLALAIGLFGATPALAAVRCDPAIADASSLETVRTDIDNGCPCGDFDGSDGHGRPDFKRCVGRQIQQAIDGEVVRRSCKSALRKMYAASVCGRGDEALAPCVETSVSGRVRCKIMTAAQCQEESGDVCSGLATCADAADTTGDLVVNAKDSGFCIPTLPTTTSTTTSTTTLPPETSTTTSTTSTTTTTTLPPETSTTTSTTSTSTTIDTTTTTLQVLCGDDSPDIVVEANRGTEVAEVVQVHPWPTCLSQNVGGGCVLGIIFDGSADIVNAFYADASTDERVCSQDDAALSYHWELFMPITLQTERFLGTWITDYDSPTFVIPASALPSVDGTGADTNWRVRLTVTPLPLEGEEITPAPSVLHFGFRYQQTTLSLGCYNAIVHPEEHGDDFDDYCPTFCLEYPERCPH